MNNINLEPNFMMDNNSLLGEDPSGHEYNIWKILCVVFGIIVLFFIYNQFSKRNDMKKFQNELQMYLYNQFKNIIEYQKAQKNLILKTIKEQSNNNSEQIVSPSNGRIQLQRNEQDYDIMNSEPKQQAIQPQEQNNNSNDDSLYSLYGNY
jgi:hypothetical protein